MNLGAVKEILKGLASRRALLIVLSYIVLMIVLGLMVNQFVNREWLKQLVASGGIMGVFIFGLIEFFYVVLLPGFNTPLHISAGYIFGGTPGMVINFVATSLGLLSIVFLVKQFGRPLLEKLVSQKFLDRFDQITKNAGPITLFIIYVIPFAPDDEMTYLLAAGSTHFKRFILPVLLGNISKSAMSYIGDQAAAGLALAVASRFIVLLIGLIIIGLQEFWFFKSAKQKISPSLNGT